MTFGLLAFLARFYDILFLCYFIILFFVVFSLIKMLSGSATRTVKGKKQKMSLVCSYLIKSATKTLLCTCPLLLSIASIKLASLMYLVAER